MIDALLEKSLLPDFLIRTGIRGLLKQRLKEIEEPNIESQSEALKKFVNELKNSPIAVKTKDANEQHYEVPTEFYQYVMGKHMKYSCCFFETGKEDLTTAEAAMLELTTERAQLKDGDDILELGCGWGSLTLFMAAKYPNAKITAVSNSKTQKEHIDNQAKERGLNNITIITCDMNDFTIDSKFDRIVSIEMFEHMRNYQQLLNRVSGFLKDKGTLFIHIFVHKNSPYLFEVKDESDWMSKYFFSGGQMPSDHLFYYFNDDMKVTNHWRVSGMHYSHTAERWLENQDKNKKEIMNIFNKHYGKDEAVKWWSYWRVFWMSCSELWKYRNGTEWFVSHYLMEKNK
jgi:cyclopropane-fatty-acyl-phospholipid synthase